MTFEEYLRNNTFPNKKGPDHTLRVMCGADGRMEFYIHPAMESGDTVDFTVDGDRVTAKVHPPAPEWVTP